MFNISFHGKLIKQNQKHLTNVKAHHGIGRYNEAREEASYQSHGPVKEGAKLVFWIHNGGVGGEGCPIQDL